jgi:hypothetical protein
MIQFIGLDWNRSECNEVGHRTDLLTTPLSENLGQVEKNGFAKEEGTHCQPSIQINSFTRKTQSIGAIHSQMTALTHQNLKNSLLLLISFWTVVCTVTAPAFKQCIFYVPSRALLTVHFLKDFTIVSVFNTCQEFFTHSHSYENEGLFHSSCWGQIMIWRFHPLGHFSHVSVSNGLLINIQWLQLASNLAWNHSCVF